MVIITFCVQYVTRHNMSYYTDWLIKGITTIHKH